MSREARNITIDCLLKARYHSPLCSFGFHLCILFCLATGNYTHYRSRHNASFLLTSRPYIMKDFGFYLVMTNPVVGYAKCAEAAVKAGVKIIQLRMKHASREEILREAREVRRVTSGTDTLFIVNDDPDIASCRRHRRHPCRAGRSASVRNSNALSQSADNRPFHPQHQSGVRIHIPADRLHWSRTSVCHADKGHSRSNAWACDDGRNDRRRRASCRRHRRHRSEAVAVSHRSWRPELRRRPRSLPKPHTIR